MSNPLGVCYKLTEFLVDTSAVHTSADHLNTRRSEVFAMSVYMQQWE